MLNYNDQGQRLELITKNNFEKTKCMTVADNF